MMNQSRFQTVRLQHARDDVAAADAVRATTGPSSPSHATDALVSTNDGEIERGSRSPSTLTHTWIWSAIDTLAARHGRSPSGLARLAGLDPTTFNPSKRSTPEGRPRWPSTASLSKLLEATGTTLDEFASLLAAPRPDPVSHRPSEPCNDPRQAPIIADIRDGEVQNWPPETPRMEDSPQRGLHGADPTDAPFALRVADDSLEPVYRRGTTLIVSLAEPAMAGDRVVLKCRQGQPLPGLLLCATVHHVVLGAFRSEADTLQVARGTIDWIGRIVWVRQ